MAGPEVPATALWLPAARDHCASQTIVARICNLDIFSTMSTVEEIESAITQLGPKEVHAVAELAQQIHRDLPARMKFARLWGHSRCEGQQIHKTGPLRDRDVVEIHE